MFGIHVSSDQHVSWETAEGGTFVNHLDDIQGLNVSGTTSDR